MASSMEAIISIFYSENLSFIGLLQLWYRYTPVHLLRGINVELVQHDHKINDYA